MKDLSLHLMDIIQNSIMADSSIIRVVIAVDLLSDLLWIEISDNGNGMDAVLLKQVTDPFTTTRTTRKVGLGIPLFKASAERSGGDFNIDSVKGEGTTLKASFKISNIDRLPLGDITSTIVNVLTANPSIDIELVLKKDTECFEFSSTEVKSRLGGVPINEYTVLDWIKSFIDEGIKVTFGGVLNEIIS